MNKIITYLSISALFIAGYCLFAIKGEAHDLSYRYNETTRQINEERNSLNILKAEFSVLQSPKRLRALAEKHLQLSSIKSDQMMEDPITVPHSQEVAFTPVKLVSPQISLKHRVIWRYKTQSDRIGNRSNIKTVSHKRSAKQ